MAAELSVSDFCLSRKVFARAAKLADQHSGAMALGGRLKHALNESQIRSGARCLEPGA